MKVPKPNFILHSIVNTGSLPELSVDETEVLLKSTEERQNPMVQVDSERESTPRFSETRNHGFDGRGDELRQHTLFFKAPNPRFFPDSGDFARSDLQLTPRKLPKLINLSFSQPNSPVTPCFRTSAKLRLATPAHHFKNVQHSGDQSVLNTPCMMGALRELQMAQDTGLPEMLALIEDDLTGLSQVERQLLRNTDMELTDNNVVDYLLDVEQDPVADAAPTDNNNHRRQQNRQRQYHPSAKARPGRPQEASELNVRRKKWCSGQKRMTDEEDLAVRRQRSTREARARARREDRSPADNKREDDSPDDRHTRSKEDDRSPVHNKKGDDSPKHSNLLEHKLVRSKAEEDWSTTDNKKEDGSPEDDHTLAKEGERSPAADNFREDASPQDKLTRTEGKDATPKETHKKSRKEDGEYRNTLERASRERSPRPPSDAPEKILSPRDTRRRASGEDGPSADRHRRDGGQTTDTHRKRVATSEARRQAKEKDESDVNRQRKHTTRENEEPVDTCLRVGNKKDHPHVDTNTRGNRKARSSLGDTVRNEDDAASVCTRRRSGRKNASVLAENCKGDRKETSNRILRTNKRRCSSMNERVLVVRRSKRRRRQSTQYVISW